MTEKELSDKITQNFLDIVNEREISIYEVCKRTGASESTISLLGKRKHAWRQVILLWKISQLFNIPMEQIITKGTPYEKKSFVNDPEETWKEKYFKLKKKYDKIVNTFKEVLE